jgi:hypothetical protein
MKRTCAIRDAKDDGQEEGGRRGAARGLDKRWSCDSRSNERDGAEVSKSWR